VSDFKSKFVGTIVKISPIADSEVCENRINSFDVGCRACPQCLEASPM
jgi:hypothetical protein